MAHLNLEISQVLFLSVHCWKLACMSQPSRNESILEEPNCSFLLSLHFQVVQLQERIGFFVMFALWMAGQTAGQHCKIFFPVLALIHRSLFASHPIRQSVHIHIQNRSAMILAGLKVGRFPGILTSKGEKQPSLREVVGIILAKRFCESQACDYCLGCRVKSHVGLTQPFYQIIDDLSHRQF